MDLVKSYFFPPFILVKWVLSGILKWVSQVGFPSGFSQVGLQWGLSGPQVGISKWGFQVGLSGWFMSTDVIISNNIVKVDPIILAREIFLKTTRTKSYSWLFPPYIVVYDE